MYSWLRLVRHMSGSLASPPSSAAKGLPPGDRPTIKVKAFASNGTFDRLMPPPEFLVVQSLSVGCRENCIQSFELVEGPVGTVCNLQLGDAV